jgi:hypothetical protein
MREGWRNKLVAKLSPYLAGLAVLVSAYGLLLILESREPGILWRVGLGILGVLVLVDNLWFVLGKERRSWRLLKSKRRRRRS